MTEQQRAFTILDAALNAPNAYSKAVARKLLAFDTNTPGWWKEVDKLRAYMDKFVGTTGGPMWEEPLVPKEPQVLAHQGLAVDASDTGSLWQKMSTGTHLLVLLVGLGVGGLAYYLFTRHKASK